MFISNFLFPNATCSLPTAGLVCILFIQPGAFSPFLFILKGKVVVLYPEIAISSRIQVSFPFVMHSFRRLITSVTILYRMCLASLQSFWPDHMLIKSRNVSLYLVGNFPINIYCKNAQTRE